MSTESPFQLYKRTPRSVLNRASVLILWEMHSKLGGNQSFSDVPLPVSSVRNVQLVSEPQFQFDGVQGPEVAFGLVFDYTKHGKTQKATVMFSPSGKDSFTVADEAGKVSPMPGEDESAFYEFGPLLLDNITKHAGLAHLSFAQVLSNWRDEE